MNFKESDEKAANYKPASVLICFNHSVYFTNVSNDTMNNAIPMIPPPMIEFTKLNIDSNMLLVRANSLIFEPSLKARYFS